MSSSTESQSQFFVFAKQLSDIAGDKDRPLKKLLPVLEELATPRCVATMQNSSVDLFSPLLRLFRYDDPRALALIHYLISCLLKCRATPELARGVLEECARTVDADNPVVQTAVFRTLADAMTSAAPPPGVPAGLAKALLTAVKDLAEPSKKKKKLLQLKATSDAERRVRLLYHLSVLMAFQACHTTLPPDGLSAALATAVGHARQAKPYYEPLIREAFRTLRRYAEQGEDLKLLEPHLPTGHVVGGGDKAAKDKKDAKGRKDGQPDAVVFATEDPFSAAELVRLCLTVVSRAKSLEGSFATCLKHLMHHPSPYVFSEAVSGIMEKGLFTLLLDRDEIYAKSRDTVLDYVIFRVAGFLNSKRPLDVHVGLRLATALCESTTRGLATAHLEVEQVERLAETVHGMEATVASHCHAFCPHILSLSSAALLWLSAFFFTLPPDGSPSGIPVPQWEAQQQRMFEGTVDAILAEVGRNVNWTAPLTTTLLQAYLRLLGAVAAGVRQRMLPAFGRLLASLYTTQPDKTDPQQLEPLLVTLLLHVDGSGSKDVGTGGRRNSDDVVARPAGGPHTAQLTITLLQTLQVEAAAGHRDSAARRKQWVRLMTCVVEFAGEHGATMLALPPPGAEADGPTPPAAAAAAAFLRLLGLLQAIAATRLQTELTHACVLAMVKLAVRSGPDVRRSVVQSLRAVAAAGDGDLDHLVTPVVAILIELDRLHGALRHLQGGGSAVEILDFQERHEGLRRCVAQYCTLPDAPRYLLLGRPSRPILDRAAQLRNPH